MRMRLVAMMTVSGVAASLLTASAAQAAPIVCEPGYKHGAWTSVKRGWKITHAKGYVVPTGGTLSRTVSVTKRAVVTSSREITAGVSYSAAWVVSSLDVNVSGTLAKAGEKTKEKTESVTLNLNKSGTYVAFSGAYTAQGYYKAKTCNSKGTGFTKVGYGKARSWSKTAEGAIKCSQSTKAGSVQRAAKAWCP
ncbi:MULTISPECIES: hypothetical protein [Streptomyces]|uniref:Uncharacterized protein n=2 Tax=Streptomyces TaxID=1883 RepID=A0ABS4V5T5_9ACTN|nr:hypothetical protein [Streptomyces sp. NRRL_B-2557]KQX81271.1 hypothetical protein ASD26_06255 [Streptomyces sp. Root1319]KQZ06746.1 hypothetical protein ASD51_10760 [Streptomyces sp. Root55]MBP2359275.1 hypothetical protein [Streptomyces clavifer]RPK80958.1 hypothetical protein EES45_12395 [Streptomyces sp. ADI97-07]GHA81313.1 hypothetical protein GCM10010392_04280 [Streptomyces clavifer]